MRKENSKGEEHNELLKDSPGERYSLSALSRTLLCSCTASRDSTKATTGTADRWEKCGAPCSAASAITRISENGSVSTVPQFV
jgi:hypothetical protein